MLVLENYFAAVKNAIWAASNGQDAARELKDLEPMQSELRDTIALLAKRPNPLEGGAAKARNAAEARDAEQFYLTWNGGGAEQITGWKHLAKRLNMRQSSIRSLFSKGKDKGRFLLMRPNPQTNEPDILNVARYPQAQPLKPKMGRPRTRPLTEAELQRELFRDNYEPTYKTTSNRKP